MVYCAGLGLKLKKQAEAIFCYTYWKILCLAFGEMQASLYCAETQAIAHGLTETIRKSSEQNRATLAEYINMTVDKKNRTRDYTAEDIANDTDGITHWLAVMQFAGNDFINYDAALMDEADENAINEKIAQEQAGAESVINDADSVIENAESVVEGEQSVGETKYSLNKDAKTELHKALYDRNYQNEVLLRDETPAIMLEQKGVKNLPMTMNASHIRENVFSEKEAKSLGLRIDDHTHYHELGEDFFLKIIDGLDNVTEAYRGTKNATDASRRENYFLLISTFKDKNGNTINVPVYIDEHALYNRVFIDTNKISTVFGRDNLREYINKQVRDKNLVRIKRSTQPSESRALIARHYGENASKDSIHQNEPKVNPDDKKISDKRDLTEKPAKTAQESANKSDKADEAKTKEKSTGAKDEGKAAKKTKTPSPSPDGATSPEGRGEAVKKTAQKKVLQNNDRSDIIDETDERALVSYMGSNAYELNAILRNGRDVEQYEWAKKLVPELDRALKKMPEYHGVTYRNLTFDLQGKKAFDKFVNAHIVGKRVTYPAYTSTSKIRDGYVVEGKLLAHIEIHGKSGHDLAEIAKRFGHEREQEVLFERKSTFIVKSVIYDGKTVNIVLEEDNYEQKGIRSSDRGDSSGKSGSSHTESGASSMQQLHTRGRMGLQSIEEENTERNTSQRDNLQGVHSRELKENQVHTETARKTAEKSGEAKESLTDEHSRKAERSEKTDVREKARKRAEKLLKWNEEQRPTVKELNDAREYVKGFDNLEISRRLAIIRMIRSAEGKVDKKILKGVANIMAAVPKADIEIRFADGIGGDKGGLYTHIGNKTLLVIDRSTDFKNTIEGTIAHELVHYLENRAGYKKFAEYVMKRVKPEMKVEVTKQYTEHYKAIFAAEARKSGVAEADIEKAVAERMATDEFKALINSEIVAKYVGKALNNEKLLRKYADKDKKFIARVGGWLARTVTSLKKNKDIDKEAVKIADEMAFKVMVLLQSESVGESSGTKYSLVIQYSNGSVEELEDARSITNEQALFYLKQAKKGELKGHSYIPVKSHTPKVIIETMRQVGENVDDLSLIMQVRKAQQSMKVQNPGNRKTHHGSNVRNHALSPEDIVAIIENLDNPQMIIYQTNRSDKDGNSLPNNIAVFVEYKNGENESVAIVEFNSSIDKEYINDEHGETEYHTVVTVFNPDTERNGIPYDYAEELLSNPDNIELEIERELSGRSATREKHPNTSNELLSKNSIHQNEPVVNTSEEKNIDKADLADTKADLSDKPKKADKVSELLNEQGEVKDEFFEAAVIRSLGNWQDTTDTAESRKEQAEKMIETRKTKFNKLIANAEKIKRKLEGFGKDADPELIKKTKKQYSEILIELGSLQRDMRMMGYDLNAENRLIEQQKKLQQARKYAIIFLTTRGITTSLSSIGFLMMQSKSAVMFLAIC